MSYICSYCQKEIKAASECEEQLVSHGICYDCFSKELSPYGQTLEYFLNTFSEPVFVVGEQDAICGVNHAARTRVKKDFLNISYFQDIRLFGCLNGRNAAECPAEIQCLNCSINTLVKKTYKTGQPFHRVPACHDLRSLAGMRVTDFFISTRKIGGSIFLHIERTLTKGPTGSMIE